MHLDTRRQQPGLVAGDATAALRRPSRARHGCGPSLGRLLRHVPVCGPAHGQREGAGGRLGAAQPVHAAARAARRSAGGQAAQPEAAAQPNVGRKTRRFCPHDTWHPPACRQGGPQRRWPGRQGGAPPPPGPSAGPRPPSRAPTGGAGRIKQHAVKTLGLLPAPPAGRIVGAHPADGGRAREAGGAGR